MTERERLCKAIDEALTDLKRARTLLDLAQEQLDEAENDAYSCQLTVKNLREALRQVTP